jgi:hypothetical protein
MDRREILARGVEESGRLIARYFRGFDDSNHVRQAPGLPNHFAWTLGHLSMVLHRAAERFEGADGSQEIALPEGDFVSGGDGRSGDSRRFDAEGVCFGSTPVGDARLYPPAARCVEIFEAAIARVARAVRGCDEGRLDQMVKWGGRDSLLWMLAVRMVFHNGTHCGQLADLRRALGIGSIFG